MINQALLLASLAWPDRFFPFLFVVAEKATTNKNGKKRSGHARLALGSGMKIQVKCLGGVYPQQPMAQVLLMADEIEPF